MTIQRRQLPPVPKGVDVTTLAANLKLFSDADIRAIKKRFTANGRYRHYLDERGVEQALRYPVFVFNGRYFAAYPGKELLLGESSSAKVKLAQDLDSGEWVVDKIMTIDHGVAQDIYRDDIDNERRCLEANHQAIVAGADQQSVNFHRKMEYVSESEVDVESGDQSDEVVSAKNAETDSGFSQSENEKNRSKESDEQNEDGKYYLFMKRASGMNLREWMRRSADLPLIVKMDISLSLINAVISVHENDVLHRDIKPLNAVFDMFKAFNHAVSVVDFGLGIKMEELHDELIAGWGTDGYQAPEIRSTPAHTNGKYSIKSDIYALGVTLGVLWDLVEFEVKGSGNGFAYSQAKLKEEGGLPCNDALKSQLVRLLAAMIHADADERPDLHEVQTSLTRLRDRLSDGERVMTVCVLDVAVMDDACEKSEKDWENLLSELHGYDQVRLFDSTSVVGDVPLIEAKQALENNGLIVSGEVYLGSYDQMESYMAEHASQRSDDGRIYKLGYLPLEWHESILLESRCSSHVSMDSSETVEQDHQEHAESYDMGEWFSWFFNSLRQDICGATLSPPPRHAEQSVGCFGLFGACLPRQQLEANVVTQAFDAPTGSDSDTEEDASPRVMARY